MREKMKKMNTYLKDLKTIAGRFGFFLFESPRVILRFVAEFNLKVRIAALLVLTGLLMPMIFVGEWRTATAASVTLPAPAPVSAPPEPFVLSSSNTVSTALISSAVTLNTFAASGYASVFGFFVAPEVPQGLSPELAQPVAPVTALASSIASSFGLIAPSPAKSASLDAESSAASATASLIMTAPGSVKFDFDGDGKADAARFQASTAQWKVRSSSINNAFTTDTVGTGGSVIAPADYDGDGRTDYAVFNAGSWTIKYANGASATATGFGQSGDKPVSGDYDGDGRADLAVWRSSNATWTIRQSASGNQPVSYQFGASSDIPVPGNYDGDARMDLAVYRPSTGNWFVQGSQSGFASAQWGNSTDIPVPADYDGDGRTDYAVYRAGAGTWYVNYSNGTPYSTISWGNYGDQPVAADYDGDGRADIAVWRPTNGVWYISKSQNGAFESFALGATGDVAVESAYYKQIGGEVYSYDFARTRLSPKNATGGTNLYSKNFSWGAGLVNLPGRAGLDAGLGVSYNSLLWTKEGSTMVFDADSSNISPGFRLGFPTIEPVYYDSASQKFNYLMVTPSGARVEFRQTTASNIYETADSSYTQLKIHGNANPNVPPSDLTITVTGTDGTQMSYAWIGNAYRCTRIMDGNGNYITAEHNEYGLLRHITDTLGRVITVNYDSDSNPVNVTQNWQTDNGSGGAAQHTYATFNYTSQPVNPNFGSGIAVYGPQGANVKLLQSIVYADGSSTRFDYNSYGQVYKVSNIAADNHVLNHTKINLSNNDLSAAQADCPRFSETRNYVENFNNGNETIVGNTITENSTYSVGGMSGAATKIEVSMTGEPNNHVSRTYVGASGWMEGLPVATEDLANENGSYGQRRWALTNWTQDNTSSPYIANPRVIESKVGDATNTKKTTIGYGSVDTSRYGLVSEVIVYDTDQSTIKKKATTQYNFDNAYISRHIIGLPVETNSYGINENGTLVLASKITYGYDEGNFAQEAEQNISPIRHDNTNFVSSFVSGRGNQTSMTRWSVDLSDAVQSVTTRLRYDVAGSPVAKIDPLNRKVTVSYADAFNDTNNPNRNSYAYPTKLTEAANTNSANNSSFIKYRFDIGANVWAKSPAPAGNNNGKETTRNYDSFGRLERETLVRNGSYTRYEYPSPDNGVQLKTYSTLVAVNDNGVDSTDEVMKEMWTDGVGRARMSRAEFPNGDTGWVGQKIEYDILGQVKKQTVPTEISIASPTNWIPAGNDNRVNDGNGNPIWLSTSQQYDWKGRVTKKINTDGTFSTATYEGCGCAGGQITRIEGEEIFEPTTTGQQKSLGKRTRKIYTDILGREYKTDIMDWEGINAYTSSVSKFNALDKPVTTRQYDGGGFIGNPRYQESIFSYDGYGRKKSVHIPQQLNGTSTSYTYYPDNQIQTITDARGVIVNYTYNNRGLLSNTSSTVPQGSNIQNAGDVSFDYDDLGNRTKMTDSMGEVNYTYNKLSRLTSESRRFYGSNVGNDLQSAPGGVGIFNISYDYDLGGTLKTITDPYGHPITYSQNKVGQTEAIQGYNFVGSVTYADNIKYRAWGSLKHIQYGSGRWEDISYNERLLPNSYSLTANGLPILQRQYQYYADGMLKYTKDGDPNGNGTIFDRLYKYDMVGRLSSAITGAEARGEPTPTFDQRPYSLIQTFDKWSNKTVNSATYWSNGGNNQTQTYVNNRNQNFGYDNDGRVISADSMTYNYDSAGNQNHSQSNNLYNQSRFSDGEGHMVRQGASDFVYDSSFPSGHYVERPAAKYYIRSSVYGGDVLTEVQRDGKKDRTFVYAFGKVIAQQIANYQQGSPSQVISWENFDESKSGYRQISQWGTSQNTQSASELDPLHNDVGLSQPAGAELGGGDGGGGGGDTGYPRFGSTYGAGEGNCSVDGVQTSCAAVEQLLGNGSAVQCPDNQCGIVGVTEVHTDGTTRTVLSQFNPNAYLEGYGFNGTGFVPVGYTYLGSGTFSAGGRTFDQFSANSGLITSSQWQTALNEGPDTTPAQNNSISPSSQTQVSETDSSNILKDVIKQAVNLLTKNPKCAAALSSGTHSALSSLKNILPNASLTRTGIYNYANTSKGSYAAETTPRIQHITDGQITLYNMFFTGLFDVNLGNTNSASLNLSVENKRLLVFLHELSHLTGAMGHTGDSSFLFDRNVSQAALNAIVYNNCFATNQNNYVQR